MCAGHRGCYRTVRTPNRSRSRRQRDHGRTGGYGITVIGVGVLSTTAVFLRDGLRRRRIWENAYERYRAGLGGDILLGLELLVAADIVGTVAAPFDLRSVAALDLVVLIRTFLSFSLEVEIKGRWPWQERDARLKAVSSTTHSPDE